MNTLVNGITYQDTNVDNPTAGNRVFTLTQVKDSGGTANGGSIRRLLAIASTVNVVPVNDAPTLISNVTQSNLPGSSRFRYTSCGSGVFSGANVEPVECRSIDYGFNFYCERFSRWCE